MIGNIEYDEYDFLWIDLNQSGKYEYGKDFHQQMYLPLTIGNQSYSVDEIDRFGKFITLLTADTDDVPPISVGLTAPDFEETTINSDVIQLSSLRGKFVILDFWTCDSYTGVFIANDIYEKFKNNDRVTLISFGPYSPESLRPRWPHVDGLFDVNTRTIYQVGGEHMTILINSEGIIVDEIEHGSSSDIVNLVEKHLAK